jgi:hypothetical protein
MVLTREDIKAEGTSTFPLALIHPREILMELHERLQTRCEAECNIPWMESRDSKTRQPAVIKKE